jgi:hypothetical protein
LGGHEGATKAHMRLNSLDPAASRWARGAREKENKEEEEEAHANTQNDWRSDRSGVSCVNGHDSSREENPKPERGSRRTGSAGRSWKNDRPTGREDGMFMPMNPRHEHDPGSANDRSMSSPFVFGVETGRFETTQSSAKGLEGDARSPPTPAGAEPCWASRSARRDVQKGARRSFSPLYPLWA